MGNTTSPAQRMGVWETPLKKFPMQQIVVETGTVVYDNPLYLSPAGNWLKSVGDGKLGTRNQAWHNIITNDYGWDAVKLGGAFYSFLDNNSQPIKPERQSWAFLSPQRRAPQYFRESKKETENPLPFPFALDLPGGIYNNGVISIPKGKTQLDEKTIELKLKTWVDSFLDHYAEINNLNTKQRDELTCSVFSFQPTDTLHRFIIGCKLKNVDKATYPKALLSNGTILPKFIVPVGDADNDRSILFAEYKNQAGKPIPSYPILRVNEVPNEHHAGNRQLIEDVAGQPNSIFIVPEEQTEAFKTTFPDIDSSTRVRPNYSLALSQQMTAFKAAQKP